MEYFHSKTDRAIRLKDIPETGAAELIKSAASQCSGGKQLLGFFGDNAGADRVRLYVILSDPEISEILAGSCLFDRGGSYESLTQCSRVLICMKGNFSSNTGSSPRAIRGFSL